LPDALAILRSRRAWQPYSFGPPGGFHPCRGFYRETGRMTAELVIYLFIAVMLVLDALVIWLLRG
jgi:hypothetical protein